VFENRVLRRIFWPKGEEVAGDWRRLHNEKLQNLCASAGVIAVIKSSEDVMGRACSRHGRNEKFEQNFGRKI
jgi:hypothetical protein